MELTHVIAVESDAEGETVESVCDFINRCIEATYPYTHTTLPKVRPLSEIVAC